MAQRYRYVPYRRGLKGRSQALRRDPSPAERRLWFDFLRTLPVKFTRQKPLDHYIADFYCASQLLVIELDGDSHYNERAERYDATRTSHLAALGLRVLRFSNTEVMQSFEAVCACILRAIDEKR